MAISGRDTTYKDEIRKWQQNRLLRLKAPDSWLSLAGLFWLEQGNNTFGCDTTNDFVIDKKGVPPRLGSFILTGNQVRFKTHPNVRVTHHQKQVTEMTMQNDSTRQPTILRWDSLSWFIIKRGESLGVRLRDSKHPRIAKLKKIQTFPIQKSWKVPARLLRYKEPKILEIPTVLGTVTKEKSPGILRFKIKNKSYDLHPTAAGKNLFIVFGDQTNGRETYYGGRFLSVRIPEKGEIIFLDFNRAYNPPCVFSHFATCPLPAKINILPIPVSAGEKMVFLK
jgi:uncharacterized protein (DUF1684 family)